MFTHQQIRSYCDDLRELAQRQSDSRRQDRITYTLGDGLLAAFSVFFMQCPSFLAHQQSMQRRKGKSNAQTLFGIKQIPTDTHIRNLLDPMNVEALYPLFRQLAKTCDSSGLYEVYQGRKLVILDGTEYFTSTKLYCKNCLVKEDKKGRKRYSHQVLTPIIAAPHQREILSLEPEFVQPQDGHDKQDCEIMAAKRWFSRALKHYPLERSIVVGDDLYCHQPFCELMVEYQLDFVLVCRPESHKTLFSYLVRLDDMKTVSTSHWNGKFREVWTYRYANGLPLREGGDALSVNFCELTISHQQTQEVLFHNSYACSLEVTDDNVAKLVEIGRCRSKVENENNNTLKTKGYNLEHNFGHGSENLSSVIVTLILLAFLMHTLLALSDALYQALRAELKARRTFFNDWRALTSYHLFDDWHQLLTFMADGLELTWDTS